MKDFFLLCFVRLRAPFFSHLFLKGFAFFGAQGRHLLIKPMFPISLMSLLGRTTSPPTDSKKQNFRKRQQAEGLPISNARAVKQSGNKPVPQQIGDPGKKEYCQCYTNKTFQKNCTSFHSLEILHVVIKPL